MRSPGPGVCGASDASVLRHTLIKYRSVRLPGRSVQTQRRPGPLLLQKRIGRPLLADRARGTVPANESNIVAERHELGLDRGDQGLMIAARNVAAADRAAEQHVADDRKALVGVEQHDTAGRMAGAVQDLERKIVDA